MNMKDVPSTERMVLCSKQWKMMTQKEKDMFQKRCEQVSCSCQRCLMNEKTSISVLAFYTNVSCTAITTVHQYIQLWKKFRSLHVFKNLAFLNPGLILVLLEEGYTSRQAASGLKASKTAIITEKNNKVQGRSNFLFTAMTISLSNNVS